MGKLQDHRIEKRQVNKAMRKPLIQDLTGHNLRPAELETETIDMNEPTSSAKLSSTARVSDPRKPEFRILREPKEGSVEKLVGQFRVPDVVRYPIFYSSYETSKHETIKKLFLKLIDR